MEPEWMHESSDNTLIKASETGWTTTELFLEWGKKCVAQMQLMTATAAICSV